MTARIWLNGVIQSAEAARIDPTDRGLTLGDGVFETIAVEDGQPLHLARHLARLRHGATRLGLPCPARVTDAAAALIRSGPATHAVLRITLTRGPGTRGLVAPANSPPTLLLALYPMTTGPTCISAMTSQATRRNGHSPLSGIKSLNYLDNILARAEAAAAGMDDALLLDTKGALACGTAANLLVSIDGCWRTPRLADGALPGIIRGLLIERLEVREARIRPTDLARAEHVLLTNSLSIRAITWLDGQARTTPTQLLTMLQRATAP